LEPGVKEIAQVAATIGRDFDRSLLLRITPRGEDEIDAALQRLAEAEIVLPATANAGTRRFRHALIQEIAYQSLLLARRRHFHGLIADAMESHYPQIVEQQPELIAQNFTASETPERAIDYWRAAGERAQARAAYAEAIAHTQAGVRLTQDLAFTDHERAERILPLLLIRGHAEFGLGERRAIATYQAAAELAQAEKLKSHLVEAALWLQVSEAFLEGVAVGSPPLLEAALAEVGDDETVDRCRLLSRLATTLHARGEVGRASELGRQAAVLARRLDDRPSLIEALSCELFQVGGRPLSKARFAERRHTLDEINQLIESLSVSLPDCVARGATGARCLTAWLEIGDLQGFDAELERYGAAVQSDPTLTVRWVAGGAQVMRAILVGDFALAERKAEESSQLAESAEATLSAGVYGMQMFTIRREQGRLGEVAPLVKRFVDENPEDKAWRPGLMLIASDLGFEAQARRSLAAMAEDNFELPSDSKHLVILSYIAEVAARLGDDSEAAAIYARLAPFADQAITVPTFTLCCGSAARYLGLLADRLGDFSRAEAYFEQALAMNESMSAWPWLAHARHDYAQMLTRRSRRGDLARAMRLTGDALATARELGMSALIQRIGNSASVRLVN
ncbi:MAG TPA: hypothetical protein VMT68_08045, partial [Caulobacteraceae bacterium]|nr:hypothetical protein [Caulobacteraceae bacterium]